MSAVASAGAAAPPAHAVSAVKSRPVYAPLAADSAAAAHLLAAEPAGLAAVLRVLDAVDAPAEVLWLGPMPQALATRSGVIVTGFQRLDDLQAVLTRRLARAGMGLRLYLAGSESFLWQASIPARAAGLREDEIRREACGSGARRVFCVHCRTVTDPVVTSPAQCSGCGLWLEVRDHFSRALAAYIGVCANAEDPGESLEPREIFR